MENWLQIVLAVFASSGLWAFLQSLTVKRSAKTKMILGLGHDRIIWLCMKYVERGWVSDDEYEDLIKYLYEPYEKMGGNGTAKRLVEEVSKLPIKRLTYLEQSQRQRNTTNVDPMQSQPNA